MGFGNKRQWATWSLLLILQGFTGIANGEDASLRGLESNKPPPQINLEKLLTLPNSLELEGVERRRGGTRSEWEGRYQTLYTELGVTLTELRENESNLEEAARNSDHWKMSPPGFSGVLEEPQTVNYQLRQAVKRNRDEMGRLQRRLRDLEVEANLAGVPKEWRKSPYAPTEELALDGVGTPNTP